jgi:hypothetical protein
MTTRAKILWLIVIVVAAFVVHGIFYPDSEPAPTEQEGATDRTGVDKALNDCFRQAIDGQRAFEITQPAQPEIRYYGQLSSEDDEHRAAWLVANACPNEAGAWDEKCRDSGSDAMTCIQKSSDLAEEAIKTSPK